MRESGKGNRRQSGCNLKSAASWPGTCRLWRLEPYRHTQFSVSLEIVLNALAGYFRPVFASAIYFHEVRPRLCAVVKRDLCVAVPGYMGSGKSRTVKEAADAVKSHNGPHVPPPGIQPGQRARPWHVTVSDADASRHAFIPGMNRKFLLPKR